MKILNIVLIWMLVFVVLLSCSCTKEKTEEPTVPEVTIRVKFESSGTTTWTNYVFTKPQ